MKRRVESTNVKPRESKITTVEYLERHLIAKSRKILVVDKTRSELFSLIDEVKVVLLGSGCKAIVPKKKLTASAGVKGEIFNAVPMFGL